MSQMVRSAVRSVFASRGRFLSLDATLVVS